MGFDYKCMTVMGREIIACEHAWAHVWFALFNHLYPLVSSEL